MAKKKTDKSKYLSNYGGGWISAPQFLAEIACEKICEKHYGERTKLPNNFWQDVAWKEVFVRQAIIANSLLKNFSIRVIICVFRNTYKAYSLGILTKKKKELAIEQKKWDSGTQTEHVELTIMPESNEGQQFTRKNKLLGLDDE